MSTDTTLTGLVLRRWDQGESDRRLSILTRERGRILATAKGARKSGSRLASVSEPLALTTFQISEGKRSGFITQAQTHSGFSTLRTDYLRLVLALSYAELVSAVSPIESPNEALFDGAVVALKSIETQESPVAATVWAQLQLMSIEGIEANWTVCTLDGSTLDENPAWLSPMAGGYVGTRQAPEFPDRFAVAAEILIGLAKTAQLEMPPPRLKYAEDALRALHRFWLHHAGRDLPASEVMLQSLPSSAGSPAS